ncbi:hypothetical protein AVEN_243848-1 [Araneus ventricosus]|uniref:Uncharacterized protein n=1 Tax=Araneus ventricosus TaxID=182803 RepID=A0A4Y2A5K9_ARAVE|nr:hypothetical protein AVEN_243848-1 [Araneus ventricosus]
MNELLIIQYTYILILYILILKINGSIRRNIRSGLMVQLSSRLREDEDPGSKHYSTKDPGSKHYFTKDPPYMLVRGVYNLTSRVKHPPAGVVRKSGEIVPVQVSASLSARGSKL